MNIEHVGSLNFKGIGSCWSIAYVPSRGTYFVIGDSGAEPFNLYEFATPVEGGTDMVLIKKWGPINDASDRLGTVGKQMVQFTSLEWDEASGGLWASYGSHYSVPESVPGFLVFIQIDPVQGMSVHGPWNCPAGIVGKVRGGVKLAPPAIREATGFDSMTFGPRASGSAQKSWGPGLVLFNRPDPFTTPPGTVIPMTNVIDWPMLAEKVGSTGYTYRRSDCPTDGEAHTWIEGNTNANSAMSPPKPSYEANSFIEESGFGAICGVRGVVTVDDRLLYLYTTAPTGAFAWYGNKHSHDDPTTAGVTWNNNLDSVVFPGQKVVSESNPKGYHAEKFVVKSASVPLQDVIDAAAIGTPQKVPWVDFTPLVDVFSEANITGLQFDEVNRRLLVMSTGSVSALHSFHVPSPVPPPPADPCQECRDALDIAMEEIASLELSLADRDSQIAALNAKYNALNTAIDQAQGQTT